MEGVFPLNFGPVTPTISPRSVLDLSVNHTNALRHLLTDTRVHLLIQWFDVMGKTYYCGPGNHILTQLFFKLQRKLSLKQNKIELTVPMAGSVQKDYLFLIS